MKIPAPHGGRKEPSPESCSFICGSRHACAFTYSRCCNKRSIYFLNIYTHNACTGLKKKNRGGNRLISHVVPHKATMVYVNTACPFFFYTPPYTYVARHVYNPSTVELHQGDQEFKACSVYISRCCLKINNNVAQLAGYLHRMILARGGRGEFKVLLSCLSTPEYPSL